MPHDESQPLPTIRPGSLPPADLPDTVPTDSPKVFAEPLLRVGLTAPPGFDLGEMIGRGGMGIVYAARDVEVGRDVAVKLLRPEFLSSPNAARRFVEEARITGQLQHPGIPAVYRVGTLPDGSPFLAMKLVKGETLADLLQDRESPAADRGRFAAIFEGICQAVGYAHAHGVIHRDLKPANVMVGAFGEVQVMDWGLAKVLANREGERPEGDADTDPDTRIRDGRSASDETRPGSVMGTPSYMPPEQAIGAVDQFDRRSDVFGLGGILCAILTGKPPYVGETAESTRQLAAQAKLTDAFTRLDGSDADPGLVTLCKRCLSGEKADRPADAGSVAAEVAHLRSAADDRARQAETARAVSDGRRKVWYAVAAALLVGAVGSAVFGVLAKREADRADTARREEATQRRVAEAKEAEANAVGQFFQDHVFAAGRPKGQDGGLGKDVTLSNAIRASLPALATGFRDQPLAEARLRFALGSTFSYLGDYTLAAEQGEKARVLFTAHSGPDHPATLTSANNLANSYAALGRLPDALKLYEETLAAQKRVLPPDHPDTLLSMGNLANSYAALGRHTDALKLYEETLAAQKRVLPPDHPHTLGSMHNLAASYAALGRHPDALKLFEETLAARKRVLPPDNPHTLLSMTNLANSYDDVGRHPDALRLREETLAAQKRVLPPDHPHTLLSMGNLAYSYAALGRLPDALRLYEETLAAQKRVLPPDHPHILMNMGNLAVSLVRLNRGAEAVPLIDECVARAAGKVVDPQFIPRVMDLRLRHFEKLADPVGCRATAEMWEKLNRPDPGSLYDAACMRAVTARVFRLASNTTDADQQADLAVRWLQKALAAGYKDAKHMKEDDALSALRRRADFRSLVAKLEGKTFEVAPPPRAGR